MSKIRRSSDRLIFIMRIPIPGKEGLYIETGPRFLGQFLDSTSMVFCQKGPARHAYAWQIGPFWQDTLDLSKCYPCPTQAQ